MTPAQVITEVRRLIQDEYVPYRSSDTVLLGYVNQALKRMAILRPDLFSSVSDVETTQDSALQTLPDDAIRLLDIFQVSGGNTITEVDRETMSRMHSGWMSEASGQPVNYMRHVKNSIQFFLYPRPTSGVVIVAEYARSPEDYALTDEIMQPPAAYFPAVIDAVMFLAQSIDDEHVNSGRAKLFYDSMLNQLDLSLKVRVVTDTKAAGLDAKQVI
jgi:hypothetical protein